MLFVRHRAVIASRVGDCAVNFNTILPKGLTKFTEMIHLPLLLLGLLGLPVEPIHPSHRLVAAHSDFRPVSLLIVDLRIARRWEITLVLLRSPEAHRIRTLAGPRRLICVCHHDRGRHLDIILPNVLEEPPEASHRLITAAIC